MASPRKLRLSVAEDPNDPGVLQKALSSMKVGEPETFGDSMKDADNRQIKYEQFNTHTPPDITKKTRIIAVLGITQEKATPYRDGWFLSDFLAFWHLFNGTTNTQTWCHCLDLAKLIKEHERFLHGNPFKDRKVVLDEAILKQVKEAKHGLQQYQPNKLRLAFKKLVTDECAAAAETGENVLIFMFGHGDRDNQGIVIGEGASFTNMWEVKYMIKALGKKKPKVTVLTTHCYSGGWSCNPDLNITTMTAAGPGQKSHSWTYSGSTGRACGSVFATAFIEKMTIRSKNEPLVVSEDNETTDQQDESYAEFTRTVYDTLLQDVDRRGYEHQLTFSAQDDAWSMCWNERTGIPLAEYQKRWVRLPDWPKDVFLHPGDPQNKDPHVTKEQRAEFEQLKAAGNFDEYHGQSASGGLQPGTVLGKRKSSGLFGGTIKGLTSVVSTLAVSYLGSYPGHDDTGPDGALHNLLRGIISGKETDYKDIVFAHQALKYRFNVMTMTDKYLDLMGLPRPKGESCYQYDVRKVRQDVGEAKFLGVWRLIVNHNKTLYPRPIVERQGWAFDKGIEYLIAAFHHANTTKDDVTKKLEDLVKVIDREVEEEKEIIKRDPEIRSKRQKLYQAFGRVVGSISPTKRSRGQSITGEASF